MSGYSERQNCPKCKDHTFEYSHDKHEGEDSVCIKCGYYRRTTLKTGTLSLKALNEIRVSMELYPLTILVKVTTKNAP